MALELISITRKGDSNCRFVPSPELSQRLCVLSMVLGVNDVAVIRHKCWKTWSVTTIAMAR